MLVSIGILAAVGAAQAQTGLALCIKPGFIINSAHIGYQSDNLFIGGGLEFASASLVSEYHHTYTDTTGPDSSYDYWSKTTTEASVFLPQVAVKGFLGTVGEDASGSGYARPYLWGSLFYSIATANVAFADEDTTYHTEEAEQEMRDLLGGNLGGAVAFGGEYYIARSLALTGEFGCRFIFGGTKTEEEHEYGYYINDKTTYKDKLGLGFTYTTLGLNFYF
jgi:hypothetical protein